MGRLGSFLLACAVCCADASAERVVWPLPDCSPVEMASASPAPAVSESSSLKALPFVMLAEPPSAAFIVGLDAANRPILRCVVAGRSTRGLIADASVAASGLTLSTPNAPNRATNDGRYLLRLSTNFGFTWVAPPPPYPLLPHCAARAQPGGSSPVPMAPTPASRVNPKYPDIALAEEMEGEVEVYLEVFSNGAASPLCISGGTPPGWFEQAAVEAIRQWRFKPSSSMGTYRVTVKFRLE
jgi:TonB family protein